MIEKYGDFKMTRIKSAIIFTNAKLQTNFRYKDLFQIFPCDFPNVPKSKFAMDFPVVIEYLVDDSIDYKIPEWLDENAQTVKELTNETNTLRGIINLLSVITKHKFYISKFISTWGLKPDDVEQKRNGDSEIFMSCFSYDGLKRDINVSTLSPIRHAESCFIKHSEYYFMNPIDDLHSEISFSDKSIQILDNYFKLSNKEREMVDRVASLINNGIELKDSMRSLSFVSVISSIETLSNFYFKEKIPNEKCSSCNQPKWLVSKKFKGFLTTFLSNDVDSVKKFKKIYGVRSKIVHEGSLLLNDSSLVWEQEKFSEEFDLHITTIQIARAALSNWLIWGNNLNPRY